MGGHQLLPRLVHQEDAAAAQSIFARFIRSGSNEQCLSNHSSQQREYGLEINNREQDKRRCSACTLQRHDGCRAIFLSNITSCEVPPTTTLLEATRYSASCTIASFFAIAAWAPTGSFMA